MDPNLSIGDAAALSFCPAPILLLGDVFAVT